jgi:RNA cap guanine-N2 methyltransferase
MRRQAGNGSSTASLDESRASMQQEQSSAEVSRKGVVVFLPKNTSLQQLSDLVLPGHTVEVERNILDGFLKGITVYFWDGLWR